MNIARDNGDYHMALVVSAIGALYTAIGSRPSAGLITGRRAGGMRLESDLD